MHRLLCAIHSLLPRRLVHLLLYKDTSELFLGENKVAIQSRHHYTARLPLFAGVGGN